MIITTRASSLPGYAQCARRWAATNVLDAAQRRQWGMHQLDRHIGAAVGSATHAGAAHIMMDFGRTGLVGSASDAREVAILSLREETADGVQLDDVTPSANDAETAVGKLVGSYHGAVDPAVRPRLVESGLKMSMGEGLTVTGHLDLFLVGGVGEDLKTGKTPPTAGAQLGAYSLMLRAHGHAVTGYRQRFIRRVAARAAQPDPVVTDLPQGVIEREAIGTARAIERDVARFSQTGDPSEFVSNPACHLCSARFCPAFGSSWCDAWRLRS